MSHELRTPLNAILGFSRLLRSTAASDEQSDRLDIINRSGEHLLALINDVLDLAKIEAGKQELAIAPCDLKSLVREVTEVMRVRAEARSLGMVCHCSPEFPGQIRADGPKLRQILLNLLGNAVKYTERGSVALRLSAGPTEVPNKMRLRFQVADTGVGISPEDQGRIFEPFVQGGRPTNQEGTGLGLTITRSFIELMGGTLSLVSTPGAGSVFTIELPAELIAEPVAVRADTETDSFFLAPGQPEWRVLVVDDQPDNVALLSELLRAAGFRVRTAENGALSVDVFTQWRPHLIFMDLRMPVMGGTEAAQRIRALDGAAAVKIVAISASPSDRNAVVAAGMDDFIRKPFGPAEIFDCTGRQLPVRFCRAEATTPATAPAEANPSGEDLRAIPGSLRAELSQAVVSLSRERVAAAIGEIAILDPALAATLRRLHDRFAYTALFKLIEDTQSEMSEPPG
jgi:CheY-like chemotaxis protein